jgi:DNA-binding transcriptional LysR family regulator
VIDLRHLSSFVTVAELLSFKRATERLHLSQAPISRHIQALEEEIGVRLLERDRRRRIVLTEAGQSFLADARLLLSAAEAARQRAQEAASGSRGQLRLANVAVLSTGVLPALLNAFRTAYPRVQVCVSDLQPEAQLAALEDGRVHAAIRPGLGAQLDSRFQALPKPLFSCPMMAVLPPGHALARGRRPLKINLLAGETLLIHSPQVSPGYSAALRQICAAADFVPGPVQFADRVENVLGMVAAGYGVAILPGVLVQSPACAYCTRPLRAPVPAFRLDLIWRPSVTSQLLQNFVAIAERQAS